MAVGKEAVFVYTNKLHLSSEGKLKLINIKNKFKELSQNAKPGIPGILTYSWLLWFIEGDTSFSTSGYTPRLKFENTVIETNLFESIKYTLGFNKNLYFPKIRDRKYKDKPVVILDITNVEFIYYIIVLY